MIARRLLEIVAGSYPFEKLMSAVDKGGHITVSGLQGSLVPLLLSAFSARIPLMVVTPDSESAESLLDDLYFLLGEDKVCFLPPAEKSFRRRLTPEIIQHHRTESLRRMALNPPEILLLLPETLNERFPTLASLKAGTMKCEVGTVIEPKELIRRLLNAGFRREVQVEECGEAALRGGILDLFPYGCKNPVRLEFWADEITSIRQFDPRTQLSVKKLDSLEVLLLRNTTAAARIFDLFESPVFWDDIEAITRRFARLGEGHSNPLDLSGENGAAIIHHPLRKGDVDFQARSAEKLLGSADAFKERASYYTSRGYRVIAGVESQVRRQHLRELWSDRGIDDDSIETGVVSLQQGFIFPPEKLAFYTEREIFDHPQPRRSFSRFRTYSHPVEPDMLKTGDFVVHEDYGIGVYQGLKRIKVVGHERECLHIKYRDNVSLYVRLEAFSRVQKYSGREGFVPAVSKIGGADWNRIRRRTKKKLKDMARELIRMHALREVKEGFSFAGDDVWQKELEDSFEHVDTIDQARVTDEIKRDMEGRQPMDRLLLGDVGFGKTEVALRAAFKAVASGKQVALLAPTTILVQQHLTTFQTRMEKYPVIIESLSRFRSPKEQRVVIKSLKEGQIDIVIGTHRLLSKDVSFKNLGLLIVDEEHRFGVAHKEKLKKLRAEVDVLTLTATPIPRTLHFALMGTRDLSRIDTAPSERLPVYTEVALFDKGLIREAILQELARGGQVYFVHNRVRSIESVKKMLRRIAPEARLAVAHGQMPSRVLEKVMVSFLKKRFDVLICTSIIESGLDFQNVNTMIINRGDKMGLAQLYQLRGRIGRSDRQAYAYLLIPPKISLSKEARKRLETISQFTELGSGFQVALRDLEIRGAGNLLGAEQSGFINSVGYDMYSSMLEEAVREVRSEIGLDDGNGTAAMLGGEKLKSNDVKLNFAGDAFIPTDYLQEEELRVNFYRKLNICGTVEGLEKLESEMADRFGSIPHPLNNLLNLLKIKILSLSIGCDSLDIEKDALRIEFNGDNSPGRDLVIRAVSAAGDNHIEFDSGPPFTLKFDYSPRTDWRGKFRDAVSFMSGLAREQELEAKVGVF